MAGSYTYDPYGKTTVVAGSSSTAAQNNPWRYTGGYQDPTDGYYHFGARYYDSAGHFNQADPIAGSLARPEKYNSYTYTAGDPINNTDLSGTNLGGDIGGVAGGLAVTAALTLVGCAATLGAFCIGAAIVGGAAFGAAGAGIGSSLAGGSDAEVLSDTRKGFVLGAVSGLGGYGLTFLKPLV